MSKLLCKDCIHCVPEQVGWLIKRSDYSFAKCSQGQGYHLVDGVVRYRHFTKYCSTQRAGYSGTCGPDGKYFEPITNAQEGV